MPEWSWILFRYRCRWGSGVFTRIFISSKSPDLLSFRFFAKLAAKDQIMHDYFYWVSSAIAHGLLNLVLPAMLFFLIAVLVKGKAIVEAFCTCLPSTVFNLKVIVLNLIIVPPVIVGLSQFLYFPIDTLNSFWEALPEVVVVFFAIFIGDFIGYWRHRLEHSKLFWPFHLMHHSDRHVNWLSLERSHPLNRLSTYVIDSCFLLLLNVPPYAIVANNVFRHYYGYFVHADLPWSYGAWGKVFVSPVMHRWHHAKNVAAYNTNFASVFSLFDRIFGTYRVPGLCHEPTGVEGHSDNNFLVQLFFPFKKIFKR